MYTLLHTLSVRPPNNRSWDAGLLSVGLLIFGKGVFVLLPRTTVDGWTASSGGYKLLVLALVFDFSGHSKATHLKAHRVKEGQEKTLGNSFSSVVWISGIASSSSTGTGSLRVYVLFVRCGVKWKPTRNRRENSANTALLYRKCYALPQKLRPLLLLGQQ